MNSNYAGPSRWSFYRSPAGARHQRRRTFSYGNDGDFLPQSLSAASSTMSLWGGSANGGDSGHGGSNSRLAAWCVNEPPAAAAAAAASGQHG